MEYEVIYLPKNEWKDTVIPIGYTTDAAVEEYNKRFPQLRKIKFPGQWI